MQALTVLVLILIIVPTFHNAFGANLNYNPSLPIFNNTAVSMVNDDSPDGPPIVAFADNTCGGRLSLVRYHIDGTESSGYKSMSYKYLYNGKCISNNAVHNIVLRKFFKEDQNVKGLYVAYIDDDGDIGLKSEALNLDGSDSGFADYQDPRDLMNRTPATLDLAIESNGLPTIVYTSGGNSADKHFYIHLIKYNGSIENPRFKDYGANDSTVTQHVHIGYSSSGNLYVASLNWDNLPQVMILHPDDIKRNDWISSDFASDFRAKTPISELGPWFNLYKHKKYGTISGVGDGGADYFDMVIKNERLFLVMNSTLPGDAMHISTNVFTYDVDKPGSQLKLSNINTLSGCDGQSNVCPEPFENEHSYDPIGSIRIQVDDAGNQYLSYTNIRLTKNNGAWVPASYSSGIRDEGGAIIKKSDFLSTNSTTAYFLPLNHVEADLMGYYLMQESDGSYIVNACSRSSC